MLPKETREKIIRLINREVVPAIGCTEPAAVALCVAKATELVGGVPDSIEVRASGNILKNAMGVGIPGTGMIGLPIAVALGALIGKSEYGLEVLRDVNAENVRKGCEFIDEGRIKIDIFENVPSILHISVRVRHGENEAEAVISGSHTNFVYLALNGKILLSKNEEKLSGGVNDDIVLDMATVYDFAMTTPLEEIIFIRKAEELNSAAAELALNGEYGHCLGQTIRKGGLDYFGDTPVEHIISLTSAACDARMGGAPVAVMSNSGSGNQGITATMPVVSFARDMGASDEQLTRALVLSHLTSIYIKQSLGRLSALCGCVVASTGASSALAYLMGGDYECVKSAIKNMIANLTGMICDGAKPSCSMKISSGVSTALMSAMLAMNGRCVTRAEGIVDDDVDRTIRNLTSIGREAMRETDSLVLKIMVSKPC